jgi:hypothetical protein
MVRDSRGVAYSWTKTVRRPDAPADGEFAYMRKYAPWEAALHWDAQNAAFALASRTGTPVLRLHYEQLVSCPKQTITEVAIFLDLDRGSLERFLADFTIRSRATHQISGNPIRFDEEPLQLRRDEAWRNEFPAYQRRVVTVLTAPLMATYGYFGVGQLGQ